MKIPVSYRLYLEPYCLIFQEEKETLIYNTINGSYICYKNTTILSKVIKELNNPENGYNTEIEVNSLEDKIFKQWIEELRETFSGDLISTGRSFSKPFIFTPILYIREKISDYQKAFSFVGREILSNLNEVFLYLPATCEITCPNCKKYNRQFPHCSSYPKEKILNLAEYEKIFAEFQAAGVARLNFMGGDLTLYEQREELLTVLENYDFKKEFYFDIRQLSPVCHTFLRDETFGMTV